MRRVHAVLPSGVDDPRRPSGGNHYDRRLLTALGDQGWRVREHPVGWTWPRPSPAERDLLGACLAGLPDGSLVLMDGIVASAAGSLLAAEAERLRLVVLAHMPFGLPAEEAALRCAHAVIATSDWTADVLAERYAVSGVLVAHPGVDRPAAPAPAPAGPGGGRLLVVGAVTRLKGHDVLVEALELIADLPWTATVMGSCEVEPDFVSQIRGRLAEHGLTERVRLAGPHRPDALATAYSSADLLVHPSRAEAYGMVVAEAQAHGVPAVATEVGGLPATVGDAGLLVPAEDAAALAEALRSWLHEPLRRDRMRAAARARARSLPRWEETALVVARALAQAAP